MRHIEGKVSFGSYGRNVSLFVYMYTYYIRCNYLSIQACALIIIIREREREGEVGFVLFCFVVFDELKLSMGQWSFRVSPTLFCVMRHFQNLLCLTTTSFSLFLSLKRALQALGLDSFKTLLLPTTYLSLFSNHIHPFAFLHILVFQRWLCLTSPFACGTYTWYKLYVHSSSLASYLATMVDGNGDFRNYNKSNFQPNKFPKWSWQ